MSKNTEIRSLQCELTQSEFMDRSKELATNHGEQTKLESDKATLSGKISKVKKEILRISRVVEAGKENREIECKWNFDYEHGEKSLIRRDTGEIIATKSLTQQEMQTELPLRVA